MSSNWYEVWAEEGRSVPYILVVLPVENGFVVIDPAEGNKKSFQSSSYDEVRFWLNEDEFVFVSRKERDE